MTPSHRGSSAMQETFTVATGWIRQGRAELPLPGGGRTWQRWNALLAMARTHLPAARIVEAHADAAAICAELDPAVTLGRNQLWAVWAAEPQQPRVAAEQGDDGWRLTGTKAWCSAASHATHALLTADAGGAPRLFHVDLTQAGVSVEDLHWAACGMASTDTGEVTFTDVPADPLGEPAGYLERAGFWHGGIGVACCWWGGAQGLIDALAKKLPKRRSEAAEAHLGACLAWDHVITGALRSAAADVDAAPRDLSGARRRDVRATLPGGSGLHGCHHPLRPCSWPHPVRHGHGPSAADCLSAGLHPADPRRGRRGYSRPSLPRRGRWWVDEMS